MTSQPPNSPPSIEPIRVYTDEQGNEVKVYPARYAEGVKSQVSARPDAVRRLAD